ncbi:MAG: hypothetical protein KAS67_02940 [Thermoplasmata archaeon]|nr:hypothetical protein [Thermoplasmata archaeon]
MSQREKSKSMSVRLKPDLLMWIEDQMEKDRFGSISNAINRCVRIVKDQEEKESK